MIRCKCTMTVTLGGQQLAIEYDTRHELWAHLTLPFFMNIEFYFFCCSSKWCSPKGHQKQNKGDAKNAQLISIAQ